MQSSSPSNDIPANQKYWLGFRVHGGRVTAMGPYGSREEAMAERERAKAPDCTVGIPFLAPDKTTADKDAHKYT
jgi:hypothetical protein